MYSQLSKVAIPVETTAVVETFSAPRSYAGYYLKQDFPFMGTASEELRMTLEDLTLLIPWEFSINHSRFQMLWITWMEELDFLFDSRFNKRERLCFEGWKEFCCHFGSGEGVDAGLLQGKIR